jgi:L-ascorbate metabolism protein UlaG (beta-lactamase superfamily)
LPLAELPRIDVVLLSHNHYDHLDLAALRSLARRDRARIVTTLGNDVWLAGRGVDGAKALDWWEPTRPCAGLEVVCTPAQHFSARNPWDRNRTLWGGFVLKSAAGTLYFAGDTGFGPLFATIGARLGPFDLALIPIGAYEPRWFMQPVHVHPDEAVRAHVALRSARSIGMHFGTFQLTDEGFDEPLRELAAAREKHGIAREEFDTLVPGETRAFGALG